MNHATFFVDFTSSTGKLLRRINVSSSEGHRLGTVLEWKKAAEELMEGENTSHFPWSIVLMIKRRNDSENSRWTTGYHRHDILQIRIRHVHATDTRTMTRPVDRPVALSARSPLRKIKMTTVPFFILATSQPWRVIRRVMLANSIRTQLSRMREMWRNYFLIKQTW